MTRHGCAPGCTSLPNGQHLLLVAGSYTLHILGEHHIEKALHNEVRAALMPRYDMTTMTLHIHVHTDASSGVFIRDYTACSITTEPFLCRSFHACPGFQSGIFQISTSKRLGTFHAKSYSVKNPTRR